MTRAPASGRILFSHPNHGPDTGTRKPITLNWTECREVAKSDNSLLAITRRVWTAIDQPDLPDQADQAGGRRSEDRGARCEEAGTIGMNVNRDPDRPESRHRSPAAPAGSAAN